MFSSQRGPISGASKPFGVFQLKVGNAKIYDRISKMSPASEGFISLTRGVAPEPHWGHRPQTPIMPPTLVPDLFVVLAFRYVIQP